MGNKYFPSHQCKQKTVMALQGEEPKVEMEEEWHDTLEEAGVESSEEITLSLNAM